MDDFVAAKFYCLHVVADGHAELEHKYKLVVSSMLLAG